jgi:hypothetical protein
MLRLSPVGGERTSAPARWHPLVLLPLALSAWVYYPIIRINFFADEFVHFAAIESDGILDFLLAPFGGHNYLVRNVFFVTAWELFGLHARCYYVTALLTHLLNVALLFGVLNLLTASAALACFGAALWGTSPLCLGTIGWFSVYGQMLVATILLFVLGAMARAASTTGEPPSGGTIWLWYGLLLAGTTCFGVGIGVALAAPVVLFLLLPAAWRRPRLRRAWLLLPVATLALYFAFRRLYPLIGTLSFQERMQEYMAFRGLGALLPMLGHLLAFSIAGATLGFFLPAAYPSPASWTAVAVVVAGLVLVLARGDAPTRRTALAMIALASAVYLLIAIGRGGAYAMFHITAAQAARVARYHYVGSIPVVVLLCLILRQLGRLPGLRAVPSPLALATGLAVIAYGIARIGVAIQEYRWTPDYVQRTADEIAAAVHARPEGSTVYIENGTSPRSILGGALPNFLFPGRAGVFVILHRSDRLDGRTVRFIERDHEVQSFYAARPNTRLARLLVRPDQVPGTP